MRGQGGPAQPLAYRPDIDGLRAVAVVPVVLHHVGSALFRGGFVGVDVFFVISGYLITRIIHERLVAGTFSLLDFYERRIRRIFPVLFAVMAAAFILTLVFYLSEDLQAFARSAMSAAVFSSNLFFYARLNYFTNAGLFRPLLHTWSLAVEEQFYLFYPLMLIGLYRWAPRRLTMALAAAAVVSLAASAWVLPRSPNAVFYLAPFRAWELFLGGVIALVPSARLPRIWREPLGWLGLGLIAYAVFTFYPEMDFPGPAALVPCGGAAILLFIGRAGTSSATALLGTAPPRFIGLISYSLYLWHWPIIVIYQYIVFPGRMVGAEPLLVAASVAAAVVSWRWIEQPFRRRTLVRTRATVFTLAGVAGATVIAAGAAIDRAGGLPQRYPDIESRIAAFSYDYNPNRNDCTAPEVSGPRIPQKCIYGDKAVPPTWAVWGDSHGTELVAGLGRLLAGTGASIVQITHTQCPAAMNFATRRKHGCPKLNELALKFLLADRSIERVVLAAHYHYYDDPRHRGPFQTGFADAIRQLQAAGKKVIVVYPVPELHGGSVPHAAALYLHNRLDPASLVVKRADYGELNRAMIDFLDKLPGPIVRIHPEDVLCRDDACKTMWNGHVLYYDGDHLNSYGVSYILPIFEPLIDRRRAVAAPDPARDH